MTREEENLRALRACVPKARWRRPAPPAGRPATETGVTRRGVWPRPAAGGRCRSRRAAHLSRTYRAPVGRGGESPPAPARVLSDVSGSSWIGHARSLSPVSNSNHHILAPSHARWLMDAAALRPGK